MERGKRVEVSDGDFPLPEPAIQHIQSFLSVKQAARTSILSKSWYNAWLTRPNLDFDIRYFGNGYANPQIAFAEFAQKTIQRYEKLNLKIENLRLCMSHLGRDTLVNELIVQAVRLGVESLNLEFRPPGPNLEFRSPEPTYVIPHEVLGAETLIKLSASGCTIDRPVDERVCKLKCLFLEKATLELWFFHDFSHNFPCLEDLTLLNCGGCRDVRISSDSLKYISFVQLGKVRANFDVPSIRKFSFSGSDSSIPSVSFGTALGEWESNISIRCHNRLRLHAKWFYRLKGFLTTLRPSKISLSLQFSFVRCSAYVTEIEGSKPVVENLMVSMDEESAKSPVILSGLLCSCRPKVLTPNWCPMANYNFLKLLCERLIQQVSRDLCLLNLNMSGLRDLEELNVEVFEETLAEWWLLPLNVLLDASPLPEILLDASTHPAKMKKLRFHFNWLSLDQH